MGYEHADGKGGSEHVNNKFHNGRAYVPIAYSLVDVVCAYVVELALDGPLADASGYERYVHVAEPPSHMVH